MRLYSPPEVREDELEQLRSRCHLARDRGVRLTRLLDEDLTTDAESRLREERPTGTGKTRSPASAGCVRTAQADERGPLFSESE